MNKKETKNPEAYKCTSERSSGGWVPGVQDYSVTFEKKQDKIKAFGKNP